MSKFEAWKAYIEKLLVYYEEAKANGLPFDKMRDPYNERKNYEKSIVYNSNSATALGVFVMLNDYLLKHCNIVDELNRVSKLEVQEKSERNVLMIDLATNRQMIRGLCIGLDALYNTGSYGVCEELAYEYMKEFKDKHMTEEFMREWFEKELEDY